ncbi:FAD binding domain-containing protein [Sporodiniella umbellata]|nr:FAD binding domain-containing protein [Sporodiniella umbellata]
MRNRSNIFMLNSGVMGMIPLQTCLDNGAPAFRIFSNIEAFSRQEAASNQPSHGIVHTEKPPSLEFLQSFVDQAVAPFKIELSNIIWSSYFKINERLANKYIDRRVILAGDSAHCHSPSGGQGMNLGLQDADNLAWKLSYVLKGFAAKPNELLESYHTERKFQAKKTLEATGNATKNSIPSGYFARVIRELFMRAVFWVPGLSNYFFKVTMQQYVAISGGESSILGSSGKGTIKVGEFLPNTSTVRRQTFNKREGMLQRFNLREIMACSNEFSVFFIGTAPSGSDPNIELMESFWKQARNYPVKRYIIGSSWHTHFHRCPSYVLDDEKEEASTSFYVEESTESSIAISKKSGLASLFPKYFNGPLPSILLFVRPDSYVAQSNVIHNQNDLDKALKYLDTIFISK